MLKIAYTSDLHLDFFFKESANIRSGLKHHLTKYFADLDSEYLIHAGDFSHFSPAYEAEVLGELKDWLGLKEIFVVQGNHSGYLTSNFNRKLYNDGLSLISDRQSLMEKAGIQVLDGTTFTLPNGKVIGGANSFYDGSYYYKYASPYSTSINAYWKRYMNDSKYMNLDDFFAYAEAEKKKLKVILNDVDLMVTHIKPVIDDKYFSREYQGELSNGFYCFDFEEEIRNSPITNWIYGHTHVVEEYQVGSTTILANPRGYPAEAIGKIIKHIEV